MYEIYILTVKNSEVKLGLKSQSPKDDIPGRNITNPAVQRSCIG